MKINHPTKIYILFACVCIARAQQVDPNQNQIDQTATTVAITNHCRPDQVLRDGICIQLRLSISDLVREILENSGDANTFLHYHVDNNGNVSTEVNVSNSVPVSDLFIQNLAVISEANMSSCLALASCNEHCLAWPRRSAQQRQHEESVFEKFNPPQGLTKEQIQSKSKDDVNIEDDDATGPEFLRTIMMGSKKGIELAKRTYGNIFNNICVRSCNSEYPECPSMHYDYTTRINAIYRQLVEQNATLYDKQSEVNKNLSPEMLYYHYSMRFLDLANLTNCYAEVSCENSCVLYKETFADDNVELVGPPPTVSPFLRENSSSNPAVDVIHNGSLIGYKLALDGAHCDQCGRHYKDCTPDRYQIARASSNIFG